MSWAQRYFWIGLVSAITGWLIDNSMSIGYGIGMAITAVSFMRFPGEPAEQVAPAPADPPKEG